jgi:PAS domain S-box-containing protein
MKKRYNFLFIEDNQDDFELITHVIRSEGIKFDYEHVSSAEGLKKALKKQSYDIVISDYKMPAFNGFEAFVIVKDFDDSIPFILVSGSIGEEMAVQAMRLGCKDYVMKENLKRLVPSIRRELKDAQVAKSLQQAEQKIREEENRLAKIFASVPSGIGMLVGQKMQWVNERFAEIAGYSNEEIISTNFRFLFQSDKEFNRVRQEILSTIEKKGLGSSETIWVRKDKSLRDVIVTSTPLDKKDETQGYILSITDITDQIEAERKLALSETRFVEMQENLPIGVYRTSLDGRFLYANKKMKEILAIKEDVDLDTLGISQFYINNEDRKDFTRTLIEAKELRNYEVRLKRLDGREICASIYARFVDFEGNTNIIDGVILDITEQKQTQVKLRESEEKHRIMMESLSDGVYICNANYEIEYVNPAMKKLVLEEDVLGKKCYKVIFQRDSICEWCEFDKVKQNQSIHKDIIHPLDDCVYSTIQSPLKHEDGQLSKMSIYRDVTESRFSQRQIEIQRQYFEGLFRNSPDAIVILDEEDEVLRVNDKFTELFGYSQDEAVGVAVNKLVVPDRLKDEGAMATNKVAKGEAVEIESIRKTKSGKEIYASVKGKPVNMPDGRKVVYAIYRDITQKVKDQNVIKLNEQRLEGLVKISESDFSSEQEFLDFALHEAISLTASKIGYIYNYEEDEKKFILNSWSKGVMEECDVMEKMTEYMLEKTGLWGEAVRQRKPIIVNDFVKENQYRKGFPEGHVKLSKYLTIPVFVGNEIVAVVGVANKTEDYNTSDIRQLKLLMDSVWKILERNRFEKQLQEAKLKAEESDRLKTAFLSNISHEIRTPMNAILGFSQLLSMPEISDEEKEEFISLINYRGTDLMRIIEDIIEVSKIEAGTICIEKKELFLNDFMKKIMQSFENNKLKEEKPALELILKPNQQLANGVEILADEEKLRMVLFNLIENAIKFTAKGKVEVEYRYSAEDSGLIEFAIRDMGIGIPSDKQKNIFEMFRQVDEDHTREFGGTGLGLAISKRFVESMGGKIWLESELGKGSCFYFTIPHYMKDDQLKKLTEERKPAAENNWAGKAILLVEDNPMNIMFIDRVLSRTGIKIYKATDGKEAVELYAMVKDINLVLMDINLPKKSGLQATKEMRAFKDNIPIIAQTAYSMPQDENITYGPEFTAILKKPYSPEQLTDIIAKYI